MWKLKLGGAKTVSRLLLITKLCFFSLPVNLSFSGLSEEWWGRRVRLYFVPCALFTLWFCFEFCVSVFSFVFLFWVLWFCFDFCDSVLNFAMLLLTLWFCFGFCDSVLGFCDSVLGFCDSVLSFVILFWILRFYFRFCDSVLGFATFWGGGGLLFCFGFCGSVLFLSTIVKTLSGSLNNAGRRQRIT